MFLIQRLIPAHVKIFMPRLLDMLQNVIENGADIGLLPPFDPVEGRKFWDKVGAMMREGSCILLAARAEDEIVGTIKLNLTTMPNGMHRAELTQLMVHSSHRRQGIGRILVRAAEDEARKARRHLLTLDSRKGDPAELLYSSMGFVRFGEVPQHVRSADGELHHTTFYYKHLKPG